MKGKFENLYESLISEGIVQMQDIENTISVLKGKYGSKVMFQAEPSEGKAFIDLTWEDGPSKFDVEKVLRKVDHPFYVILKRNDRKAKYKHDQKVKNGIISDVSFKLGKPVYSIKLRGGGELTQVPQDEI